MTRKTFVMIVILSEKDLFTKKEILGKLGYPIARLRTLNGNSFGRRTLNPNKTSYSIIPIVDPTPITEFVPYDMSTCCIIPLPDNESDRNDVDWNAKNWKYMKSFKIVQGTQTVEWNEIKWNPKDIPTELTIIYDHKLYNHIDYNFDCDLYTTFALANGYCNIVSWCWSHNRDKIFVLRSRLPDEWKLSRKLFGGQWGILTRTALTKPWHYELHMTLDTIDLNNVQSRTLEQPV